MGDRTGISWTDATWNPLRGCSRVSAGCVHCYAEIVAARFSGPDQPYEGLLHPITHGWNGQLRFVEGALEQPLRWSRSRLIFVNSMSDLFHENVPDDWIDRIFAVMALAPRHTFQVLTKRPERMLAYLGQLTDNREHAIGAQMLAISRGRDPGLPELPLPNVWLGVSVEDQAAADVRIPLLLQCPATVRWLSCE
ncbi:Phage Gp37Gp68, partial [mine drainage metagenome]